MTIMTPNDWRFEDGWILMAIYMNSERGPAALDQIVSAADACNHAIPTAPELNGALDRLLTIGVVESADGCFSVNSSYVSRLDQEWAKPGGLFEAPRKGLKWLQANWPTPPAPGTTTVLSSEQITSAYDTYRARHRRRR